MIVDFLLFFDGKDKGVNLGVWQERAENFSTAAYFKRRKELGQSRMLISGNCSTREANIPAVRDQVISKMRLHSGGTFDKQAVVCLFGSSNGASLALAVAAALGNELTVNYVCLADLPLFMGGRQPPIPGVGPLAPSDPNMVMGAKSTFGSTTVLTPGDRPRVMLAPDINAKVKENFFQNSGNWVRRGALHRDKWFWYSDMAGEEIHGVITNPGWNDPANQEVGGLSTPDPRFFLNSKADVFHQVLDDHVELNIWPGRWPVEIAKF